MSMFNEGDYSSTCEGCSRHGKFVWSGNGFYCDECLDDDDEWRYGEGEG